MSDPDAFALPSPLGHHYYSLFYLLAFGLNQVLLLWEGYRRGYPLRTWLLLMACTTLAFILGTKLLAIPAADWPALWQHGQWPSSTARTALGGAISGTVALLALRRWLGFSWHVFDAFSVPFCVGLAVQCVGCLLTGCCFGELTHKGLGICYAPGTPPFLAQVQRGLLPATAAHSLPVLPVQLYQLLLCLGAGAVLLLLRRRVWPGGSWRLLGLGLLLLGRFGVEFGRDPYSERVGAALLPLAGVVLKQVQWGCLLVAVVALLWWAWLVRRSSVPRPETVPVNNSLRNLVGVAALLGITALLGPWALTLPEVLVIKALLLPVVGLEVGSLLLHGAGSCRPRLVGLPLGLASVVLLFTNQMPAPADSATQARYWSVTGGVGNGRFSRMQEYESSGCGSTTPAPAPFRHQYQSVNLGIARVSPAAPYASRPHKADQELGVRVLLGRDQEYDATGTRTRTTTLYAFNPYANVDRRYYGLGLGLIIGPLGYNRLRASTYDVNPLGEQLSVRLGPRELIYAQGDYNAPQFGLGNLPTRLGLGSQFRSGGRVQLLLGVATGQGYATPPDARNQAFFLEASLRPIPNLSVQPYLTLGGREFRQASLQLRYDLRK